MPRQIILPSGHATIVSDVDYDRVCSYPWWRVSDGHVGRALRADEGKGFLLLHRFIMDPEPWEDVHHANENRLDNRRENLEVKTRSQHAFDHAVARGSREGVSSRYKGVTFSAGRRSPKKWKAMIYPGGSHRFLGWYLTPQEAAVAYDLAAREIFGPCAYINFPQPF